MQVVSCPQCNVELDHDAEDVGYLVECPACLKQFVAASDLTGAPLKRPSMPVVHSPIEEPITEPVIAEETPSTSNPTIETLDTLETECRVCHGIVSIEKIDVGHQVQCPLCQQVFLATVKKLNKPSRRAVNNDDDDEDDEDERNLSSRELRKLRQQEQDDFNPKRMLRNAQADLGSVAGAITVLGWIDIVCGVLSIILGVILLIAFMNTPTPGGMAQFWVYMNIFPGIGGTLLGIAKVFAGKAMKSLKNRNMSLMGCWASLLPLNVGTCISFIMFPTYIVSLVFGIVGLVNLSKLSVKKAFEFNKPDGDVDLF